MISPASMIDEVEDFAMGPSRDPATSRASSSPLILAGDFEGIPRLRTEEDEPLEAPSPDWDIVHSAVQDALEVLSDHVVRELPDARWEAGRCRAKAYSLFSYRTFFHLDGDDYDPIIVGLTCTEDGSGIRISGDISGDESGRIYFDADDATPFAIRTGSVYTEAVKVAELLASQHRLVVRAIRDRHAGAMPR